MELSHGRTLTITKSPSVCHRDLDTEEKCQYHPLLCFYCCFPYSVRFYSVSNVSIEVILRGLCVERDGDGDEREREYLSNKVKNDPTVFISK